MFIGAHEAEYMFVTTLLKIEQHLLAQGRCPYKLFRDDGMTNALQTRVRSRMFYERKQFIEHSVIGGNLNILRRLFPSTWVRNEELVK